MADALRDAYFTCENHIMAPCDKNLCISICLSRPGAGPCGGAYEWVECNDIARRWLSSSERAAELARLHDEQRSLDETDREIVKQGLPK